MSSRVTKHHIHILQGFATGLWDEKICEAQRKQTEDGEEDVRAPLDRAKHVWSDEADDKIADPGRAGGD